VDHQGLKLCRRRFLASAAAFTVAVTTASARSISGKLPWSPFAGDPPKPVNPLGWYFLTPNEVAAVEAVVDRLIPADHLSPSGKDAGCAVFIDRQLAGSFGSSSRLYMKGPFQAGLPTQGYQGELTPSGRYRLGLKALDDHARATYQGKTFAQLSAAQQDEVLEGMESGKVVLKLARGFDTRTFFELLLQNTMEGFFADPLYGGNRNMVSWKMIGFPGARYDYRDYILKYNQPYPFGPVSIYGGEASWTEKG
jgi:gluconate 2-dehydrogenase gamma chain